MAPSCYVISCIIVMHSRHSTCDVFREMDSYTIIIEDLLVISFFIVSMETQVLAIISDTVCVCVCV